MMVMMTAAAATTTAASTVYFLTRWGPGGKAPRGDWMELPAQQPTGRPNGTLEAKPLGGMTMMR